MQPTTLEYRTPQAEKFVGGWLLRALVLGPCTGAWIGFVQTTAATLCWISHGKPDFYFRGRSGVESDYILMIVCGGVVGVGYGALLWGFERIFGRRVRILVVAPILTAIAFGAAFIIASIEFQRQRIGWVFSPELVAIVAGLLLSVATARKVPR
jgi:hypothetical protein